MDIIPVIDVARGVVVRAKRGDRANYLPIVDAAAAPQPTRPMSRRGSPSFIAFRKVYLADLDGIEGRGRNVHLVPELSRALPGVDIWIDAGTGSRGAARALAGSTSHDAGDRV